MANHNKNGFSIHRFNLALPTEIALRAAESAQTRGISVTEYIKQLIIADAEDFALLLDLPKRDRDPDEPVDPSNPLG